MARGMSGQELITSRENRWLKRFRAALGGAPGKLPSGKAGECVGLEGPRLVEEGLRSGIAVEAVLVCEEGERHLPRLKTWMTPEVRLLRCSSGLFASVAATESPQGIAALARVPQREFEGLLGPGGEEQDAARKGGARFGTGPGKPLVVVLAGVQDPGNVGTLVRSAEAFGATGLVACRGTATPLGPKALRASAGSALRLPMQMGVDAKTLLAELGAARLKIYSASLTGDAEPSEVDLTLPCALVIGNEATGVPAEIEKAANARMRILLAEGVESLNAAVAGAVVLYEAAKQRAPKRG
jgi:RNA methyltransferase, TrmH family